MRFNALIITGLLVYVECRQGQQEFEEHGSRSSAYHAKFADRHYKHGEHESNLDHEAVLGSKKEAAAFDKMSPEESKLRLGKLAEKMDTNKDGFVDDTELYKWIDDHLRALDAEEADERFEEVDQDADGFVTWSEYIKDAFGEHPEDPDEERLMKEDEEYFKAADKDGDGKLTKEEFRAFQAPEEHAHMHEAVVHANFRDKDRNNDGRIDLQEFLGEYSDKRDSDWMAAESLRFKDLDKNGDGHLDNAEARPWLAPEVSDVARQETTHLMTSADADHDGQLSYAEMQQAHELFVGSEATNFGEHLTRHIEL